MAGPTLAASVISACRSTPREACAGIRPECLTDMEGPNPFYYSRSSIGPVIIQCGPYSLRVQKNRNRRCDSLKVRQFFDEGMMHSRDCRVTKLITQSPRKARNAIMSPNPSGRPWQQTSFRFDFHLTNVLSLSLSHLETRCRLARQTGIESCRSSEALTENFFPLSLSLSLSHTHTHMQTQCSICC